MVTVNEAGRRLVGSAVSAGRAVLHHGRPTGSRQQTMTIARPVEDVLRAGQDSDVLSTLLGATGDVAVQGSGSFSWTLAGTSVDTELFVEPHRVVFRTRDVEPVEALVLEARPELRWGGAEVVLRLTFPGADGLAGGALAFTMLYRLRALLQTGEVPTLGDVPSGRDEEPSPTGAGTDDGGVG